MRLFFILIFAFLELISGISIIAAEEAKNQNSVEIGGIAILSGDGAAWGINQQRGTLLAVEEINQSGGIHGKPLIIHYEDSPGGLAQKAVSAYKKLVSIKKVKFIIGPSWQDEVTALAPLAVKDKVFLIAATYMPNPTKNLFSVWIDADIEASLLADFVFKRHKKVAILSSQQSWEAHVAKHFKETFSRYGGQIISYQEPASDAIDVKTEVLKIAASRPDAISISSYNHLAKYTKQLRVMNIAVPIYGIEFDQTVIDSTGGAADGIIFIGPSQPSNNFVIKFKARWNSNPDIPAVQSYDATHILSDFLNKHGEDVDTAIRYFDQFVGYSGASGRLERLNAKTTISTSFYEVHDGQIIRYAE